MPDITANGTTDEPAQPHLSVASTRAVDAYRRMITLQHELDEARAEYGRLVQLVPATDQVAFYEVTTQIRTDAHQARHAADAEPDSTPADATEVAHGDDA
jgi:hypothetical protein